MRLAFRDGSVSLTRTTVATVFHVVLFHFPAVGVVVVIEVTLLVTVGEITFLACAAYLAWRLFSVG